MGSYFNSDGLYVKIGTTKAVPNIGGEFKAYGEQRIEEFKIDISTLTTTATIISDQTWYPQGMFLEEVNVDVQTAVATITSVSVGLMQDNDRTTSISDTAILNAEVLANLNGAGKKITYVTGTANAGTAIGTVAIAKGAAFAGMVTAKIAGSAGTGIILVRIKYRPVL